MDRRSFLFSAASMFGGGDLIDTYWRHRWKYIIVHHSAGSYGDIPFLQRVHRQRQPHDHLNGIPYHYVIGNGNGLGLGEIASDKRHTWNLWAIHVSRRNFEYNFRGIGICLVGNFEKTKVPLTQYQALVRLTKELMVKHDIQPDHIYGHGMLPRENTKCPGKNFPMLRFKYDIAQGD